MIKTEFFETAVKLGYYGPDKGGLFGKKDNVRKYWEDFSIKSILKPVILEIINRKEKLRILDLGCGSGEGFELITHISPVERPTKQDSLLTPEHIELYLGVDISESMINEGKNIYIGKENMKFKTMDISGEYSFLDEEPFDIYLSTYSSPSHLTGVELCNLVENIFKHTTRKSYLLLDLFGKYSPEWPCYWNSNEEMLQYNMAWLHLPKTITSSEVDSYFVKFWECNSLIELLNNIACKLNKTIKISTKDRSIFVGRHIDTGFYNENPQPLRYQVNRLFDRDYEGRVADLKADFNFLNSYVEISSPVLQRINLYQEKWNTVIDFCSALIDRKNSLIKKMIENTEDEFSEDLKMLAWLYRNSQRFPVDNFWASIMGPQVACVLRNIELNLPDGLGCGHGIVCLVEMN